MNSRLAWRVAIRDSDLDATARHVALTLDVYMNRHGVAWPSRSSLAAGTGRSTKTVDRALAHLEQAGFLMVIRGHGRRSNRYRAIIPSRDTSTTTTEGLVGTLATSIGTFGTRSRDTTTTRSRKEVVIKKGKPDRARDQVKPGVDPVWVEAAHGWLKAHADPSGG